MARHVKIVITREGTIQRTAIVKEENLTESLALIWDLFAAEMIDQDGWVIEIKTP